MQVPSVYKKEVSYVKRVSFCYAELLVNLGVSKVPGVTATTYMAFFHIIGMYSAKCMWTRMCLYKACKVCVYNKATALMMNGCDAT